MSLFGKGEEPPADPKPDNSVPGERGIASVNRAPSMQSRISSILAMSLMSALGLGLLTWYYANTLARHTHAVQSAQSASKAKAQGEMALPSLGHIDAPRVLGPPPDPPPAVTLTEVPVTAANASPYGATPANPSSPPTKTPAELALERRLAGPAFASRDRGGEGPLGEAPVSNVAVADESAPRAE